MCERRYVFNASTSENASGPLAFSPSGKCPVYEVPPEIAQLVAEKQSKDHAESAQLASFVAAAPVKRGVDGGMNPVFLAQMQTAMSDNDGRVTGGQVTTMHTPGALPRTGNNPPAVTVPPQPVRVAEAEPLTAPSAPAPNQSRGIAGLLGNMFGSSNENAQPISPAPLPPARSASRTAVAAAKPAQPGPTLAAASQQPAPAPIAAPRLRPQIKEETAVAAAAPKAQQQAQAEPQLRTAFTASPSQSVLLSGAQPVMPAGSFESRWSAFR